MKVKALVSFSSSFAGARGFYAEGEMFELPVGVDWLRAGLVEPVEPVESKPETAALDPAETAARPKRTSGRRKKT